jgi:hypothetical protein
LDVGNIESEVLLAAAAVKNWLNAYQDETPCIFTKIICFGATYSPVVMVEE